MKRLKVTKSDDIFSFDLMRLTWLGWLLVLLAIAVGVGLAVLTAMVLSQTTGRRYGVVGTVSVGGGILFFVVVKVLLGLAGVSVIKPAKPEPRRENDEERPIRKSRAPREEDDDDWDNDDTPRRRQER